MAKKTKRAKTKTLPHPIPRPLRSDYGVSLATFARMAGVPTSELRKWEEGSGQFDAAALARIDRVGRILSGLARVMRKSFIPTWLEQPNNASKEIGVRAPIDLLEQGKYQEVEAMVFYLGSGVPS